MWCALALRFRVKLTLPQFSSFAAVCACVICFLGSASFLHLTFNPLSVSTELHFGTWRGYSVASYWYECLWLVFSLHWLRIWRCEHARPFCVGFQVMGQLRMIHDFQWFIHSTSLAYKWVSKITNNKKQNNKTTTTTKQKTGFQFVNLFSPAFPVEAGPWIHPVF